jgi:hypothetical protein
MLTNNRWTLVVALTALTTLVGSFDRAAAEILINEIYSDPPGAFDELSHEYIELRGTPGMSLADHYLILLENEGNVGQPISDETGKIENIFNLSSHSVGSNGFLTIRRAGNPYSIADGTTNVIVTNDVMENSGFTAMLINKGTGVVPTLGLALDGSIDNDSNVGTRIDGLDYPGEGQPGWQILDAIGFFGESGEAATGRTYAHVNFGPERIGQTLPPSQGGGTFSPHIEPDAVYISTGYEIEYMGRYGNSTGQTPEDWHISNVTDNGLAGFVSAADGFRQSAPGLHGFPRPNGSEFESNQYVPYGTNITDTLGAANYPLNQSFLPWDFNHDGSVDAVDYTVWRNTLGQTDPTPGTNPLAANADRDGSVDMTDYDAWKAHYGESLPLPAGAGIGGLAVVPEPATVLLLVVGAILGLTSRLPSCRRSA